MNFQIVIYIFLFATATQAFLLSATNEAAVQILYSCNFENDTCQMTIEPSLSGFTWQRASGSTPSEDTGPDFDHTTFTSTGHYMYTEATEFQPGEIAKLRLPSLNYTSKPEGAVCLTFWYHMFGEHIGTLNVTHNNDVLFSLSFNQTYNWIQQNVTIQFPSAGSIAFVGVRGGFDIGQPFGDIAIDDIVIYNELCEQEITTEEPTTTMSTTVTTTQATTTTLKTTHQSSLVTNETFAVTSLNVTTKQLVATTQSTATATTSELNLTTSMNALLSVNSAGLSQNSSVTTEVFNTSGNSNISSTESQLNSTDKNITFTTEKFAVSTDGPNVVSITATETNNSLNHSTAVSPAAVELTASNGTNSTMSPVNTTDNSTKMNTVNLNVSSFSTAGGWKSTVTMKTEPESQGSSPKKIWNLTEQNLIILLAFLSAFIVILLLVVCVLCCCLCATRRKYNVARSANVYNSNTTLDRSSVNENQRVEARKSQADYM